MFNRDGYVQKRKHHDFAQLALLSIIFLTFQKPAFYWSGQKLKPFTDGGCEALAEISY